MLLIKRGVKDEVGFESHEKDFIIFKVEEIEIFWWPPTFKFTQHYINIKQLRIDENFQIAFLCLKSKKSLLV